MQTRKAVGTAAAVLAMVIGSIWVAQAAPGADVHQCRQPGTTGLFTGDYSTGNLSQWRGVDTSISVSGPGGYPGGYPVQIVPEGDCGYAARFEVHEGDIPNFQAEVAGHERSEVAGPFSTGGLPGDVRWYRFSTKFDASFPATQDNPYYWHITNQWHAVDKGLVSPVLFFGTFGDVGVWQLRRKLVEGFGEPIWETPATPGVWHDIQLRIEWGITPTTGSIQLWHNGVRQTFENGQETFIGQTMPTGSGDSGTYYREGLYRHSPTPWPGVVYHTGFQASLVRLTIGVSLSAVVAPVAAVPTLVRRQL